MSFLNIEKVFHLRVSKPIVEINFANCCIGREIRKNIANIHVKLSKCNMIESQICCHFTYLKRLSIINTVKLSVV